MHCNARYSHEKAVLSVSLSNVWIVTKRKELVPTFLYHTKDHSSQFIDKKNGWWWWRQHPLPEILGQNYLVGVKTPIFNQ